MKKAKVIVAGTNHFTDYDYLSSALNCVFSYGIFEIFGECQEYSCMDFSSREESGAKGERFQTLATP